MSQFSVVRIVRVIVFMMLAIPTAAYLVAVPSEGLVTVIARAFTLGVLALEIEWLVHAARSVDAKDARG